MNRTAALLVIDVQVNMFDASHAVASADRLLARGLEVTLVSDAHSTYDSRPRTAAEITTAVNAEFAGRAALTPSEGVGFS